MCLERLHVSALEKCGRGRHVSQRSSPSRVPCYFKRCLVSRVFLRLVLGACAQFRRAAVGSGVALAAHMAFSERARRQVGETRDGCGPEAFYPSDSCTGSDVEGFPAKSTAVSARRGAQSGVGIEVGRDPTLSRRCFVFACAVARLVATPCRNSRPSHTPDLNITGGSVTPPPSPPFLHQAGAMLRGSFLAALAGTATVCAGLVYLKPGESVGNESSSSGDATDDGSDQGQPAETVADTSVDASAGVSGPEEEGEGRRLSRVWRYRDGMRRWLTTVKPSTRNLVRWWLGVPLDWMLLPPRPRIFLLGSHV